MRPAGRRIAIPTMPRRVAFAIVRPVLYQIYLLVVGANLWVVGMGVPARIMLAAGGARDIARVRTKRGKRARTQEADHLKASGHLER